MSFISATTLQALSMGAEIAKNLPAVNDIVTQETDLIQNAIYSTISTTATSVTVPATTPMTNATTPVVATTGTVTATIPQVTTATVETATNTGVLTFTSNHNLLEGAVITLSGWSPDHWNGNYAIKILSSTQVIIQFPIIYIPVAPRVLGKVTYSLPLSPVGLIGFTAAHRLTNNETVTLSNWQPTEWNGSYPVTVVDDTHIDIPFQTARNQAAGYGDITTPITNKVAGTRITPAAGLITFTTAHGMADNTQLTLTNWLPLGWNGTYSVSVINATTISIPFVGVPPGAPTSIGDLTVPTQQVIGLNFIDTLNVEMSFAKPHRLKAGDKVLSQGWNIVSFNGLLPVTAIYDPYVIRVKLPYNAGAPEGYGTITLPIQPVVGLEVVPVTGTVVFDTPHVIQKNDVIVLSGWQLSQWNGTYTVTDASDSSRITFAFGVTAPTGVAQYIGTISLKTPRVVSATNQNLSATTNTLTGTINFTTPVYLDRGGTIILSGWSVGWDNTYTVTSNTAKSLSFNFLEPAQKFYNVWQGNPNTPNYAVYSNYMNSVINTISSAGYTITRKKNTATGTTFVWEVSW